MRNRIKPLLTLILAAQLVELLVGCAPSGPKPNATNSHASPFDDAAAGDPSIFAAIEAPKNASSPRAARVRTQARTQNLSPRFSRQNQTASPNRSSPIGQPAATTPADVSGAVDTRLGTGHTGGGNGTSEGVYISSKEVVETLPAYIEHIKPLFNNIDNDIDKDGEKDKNIFFFPKTWYIADVNLETITKELLGITFIETDTVQFARQTKREVWISKTLWEKIGKIKDPKTGKMTETTRRQADLLLHEIIESLYLLKFYSFSEICREAYMSLGDDGCNMGGLTDLQTIDRMFPGEKPRIINARDNENIRVVTGWLLENATKPIKLSSFFKVLVFNGFDKRFFDPNSETSDFSSIKLNYRNYLWALKANEATGRTLNTCQGMTSGQKIDCKLTIDVQQIPFNRTTTLPGYVVNLEIAGSKINVNVPLGFEESVIRFNDVHGVGYMSAAFEAKAEIRFGDRLHTLTFFFSRENLNSGLVLDSIMLRPSVVVAINRNDSSPCQFATPSIKSIIDETIVVYRHDGAPSSVFYTPKFGPLFCDQANLTDEDPFRHLEVPESGAAQNGQRDSSQKPPQTTDPVQVTHYYFVPKPDISSGQKFKIKSDAMYAAVNDFRLPQYFSRGREIAIDDLKKVENLPFCTLQKVGGDLTETPPSGAAVVGYLQPYLPFVVFDALLSDGTQFKFQTQCGTVLNGSVESKIVTSLSAIKENFKGMLEFDPAQEKK